ncbi:MAG: hypothetical protein ACI9HK_003030 [Pirellulaceae bacterium]
MRASSLSNQKVIELLNSHFIPVYVDGTYLQANSDTEAAELKAYRELFAELNRANGQRKKSGQSQLSIGTVHAYVFKADGDALDSRHVAHAGPASVIEMLQNAVKTLQVPDGKPIVAPSSQSPRPDCANDALTLHLTARYLVPSNSSEARQGVQGELVPLDASRLGGERSGQWSALPSEDWIVFNRNEWTQLLPKTQTPPNPPIAVGDTWQIEPKITEMLLTRFYPTTELNDLSKNRLDEQSLKLTALSVEKGRVRARIDGRLKMKHPFYPGRDDDNFVTATIVGVVEFDPAKPLISSLHIATENATYGIGGKRQQPFGVAVQIVP